MIHRQAAHFHVDGHNVGAHTLLDVHQGKTVTITYNDAGAGEERMKSFAIPTLHAGQPVHHQVQHK